MFYVYILFSLKDKRLYTGYTNNLRKRYSQHQNKKVIATKGRLPLKLIYYEAYELESDARRREKYLKGGNGRSTLKIQLQNSLKNLGYRYL